MYEMRIGVAHTGTGLVWHVVAHDRPGSLCGQPLEPGEHGETDRHCLPCMATFQRSMQNTP
ncbi:MULTISPECIES: hypothetical protein [unclassified Streptomyces]|uniref:hypothetical protein n=1 Tax=unclassified Streptomyces TaxID=2593676 RepID=UPI001BE6F07D|nr:MULTISPECIES: hypothetical protein [unclassified Streptomyces]MBT2406479.1 hypothetical protein [Streptomyces sp. ISL-21]MBT2455608.1 hypothetical protein [Streptomyces sp. ISL-86]MBT2612447.1 hypothetical protein [Streptomyces sp. ISL-87]